MKAEQVRREAEDKQNFLLQQLRAAEARTLETSSILRKSQSREAPGMAVLPASLLSLHRDSVARESLMSADSFGGGGGGAQRRSGDSANNTSTNSTDEERYNSERQRREQLERRNSELVKELKTFRASQQRA
jgi:hypothetical protein